MIEFKDYQEKAIVKLKTEVNELLESQNDEVVVFKWWQGNIINKNNYAIQKRTMVREGGK